MFLLIVESHKILSMCHIYEIILVALKDQGDIILTILLQLNNFLHVIVGELKHRNFRGQAYIFEHRTNTVRGRFG